MQRADLFEKSKKYARIDYEDDDDIVELMLDVTLEEMTKLIPNFSMETLSHRQKLLILVSVKDLYYNREKLGKDPMLLHRAVSSLLLKEMYGGGT